MSNQQSEIKNQQSTIGYVVGGGLKENLHVRLIVPSQQIQEGAFVAIESGEWLFYGLVTDLLLGATDPRFADEQSEARLPASLANDGSARSTPDYGPHRARCRSRPSPLTTPQPALPAPATSRRSSASPRKKAISSLVTPASRNIRSALTWTASCSALLAFSGRPAPVNPS
jgi:hypothetical protein